MSFIDWSDPEGLLGLLVEYVADERSETRDPVRRAFLSRLRRQLARLQGVEGPDALRAIRRAVGGEFEADPVVEHLDACIEELDRIRQSRG